MLLMANIKRKSTGGIETAKSRKNQNTRRKGKIPSSGEYWKRTPSNRNIKKQKPVPWKNKKTNQKQNSAV